MNCDDRPVIVHVVQSLEGGGTERFLVALLRAFNLGLFRHTVVTLRDAGSLSSQLPDDVACYPLGVSGRSWSAGWMTARAIRSLRPVIIHARNTGCWGDAVVARLLLPKAHLVLGFHGLDNAFSFTRRQRLVMRWGSRLGARFTSVSDAGVTKLRLEGGVRSERIDVLPNGVKVELFKSVNEDERRRMRQSLSFADASLVVGTVGSLTAVKAQSRLIDAVAQLAGTMNNVRLLIVGDGPLRVALIKQAAAAGVADRVCFTGWRDDVPSLLTAMDVYVCSSASEGMSNAVLEAMASGLAVVATDVGDNAIMIRNYQDGLIIEPQSPTAIAQAVRMLTEEPELRRKLGAAARGRALAYGFDRAVQNYERYYGNLVATNMRRWNPRVQWSAANRTPLSDFV